MTITLHQVRKRLGAREVLRQVSLEIQDRELFFVLGPSGGGKTTLLRLLGGFLQPDAGEIRFNGRVINSVPPHLRRAAMVFQHHALWPHLTVADNVGYGLDVRGVRGAERRRRIAGALAVVRLEDLADRLPAELSGGQQQRVALARALVIEPDVLLLDEPLSNLDPSLRTELRDEIRRIHADTQVTMVYVTHDRQDALALSQRAAVLNEGVIEQIASPPALFRRPATRFVAEFLGEMNWLEGEILRATPEEVEVGTELGPFVAAAPDSRTDTPRVWVGFRPRDLRPEAAAVNCFDARPRRLICAGEHDELVVEARGGRQLKLHFCDSASPLRDVETVTLSVKRENVVVLPRR